MKVSSFFRDVVTLPSTENELGALAARVAELCEVPLAAVVFRGGATGSSDQELIGIGTSRAESLSSDLLAPTREYLRRQFHSLSLNLKAGDSYELQQASGISKFAHFGFVPITTQFSYQGGRAEFKGRENIGCIALGSSVPVDAQKGTLAVAAALRLTELLEISQMDLVIQQRSQFLSIASHELKTPLTAIYGILQLQERMLRQKREEPDAEQLARQHSFLKMVIRQVERLNELIDGLLDVSRIQNGRFMVEPSESDVAAILGDSVIPRMKVIAEDASVTLKVEAPSNLLVWVDPVRFEEVVINLVMNAIRFSPEGGTVWVRLSQGEGSFRLSVRDQGPCVPIEDRERIFHPFERAQRTSRMGGMGLGLFISRQIAQLHGGNVVLAESVPGKGNLFEAVFPTREITALSA